ncbi:hypothetical protein ACQPZF_10485 [Actinosynnema sp. CS-041913]|uniref:hypothetical protein n=1 Tax=Actinosynnema sp. CS-041913 TaxID=3239917 RepID=UPI003D93D6E0
MLAHDMRPPLAMTAVGTITLNIIGPPWWLTIAQWFLLIVALLVWVHDPRS